MADQHLLQFLGVQPVGGSQHQRAPAAQCLPVFHVQVGHAAHGDRPPWPLPFPDCPLPGAGPPVLSGSDARLAAGRRWEGAAGAGELACLRAAGGNECQGRPVRRGTPTVMRRPQKPGRLGGVGCATGSWGFFCDWELVGAFEQATGLIWFMVFVAQRGGSVDLRRPKQGRG